MSAAGAYGRRSAGAFRFPSANRVLIYLCALFIAGWSVGPFLWQTSTSLQLDKQLARYAPKNGNFVLVFTIN